MRAGRLSLASAHDDVHNLWDGMTRLNVIHFTTLGDQPQESAMKYPVRWLVYDYVTNPPHSPFSTYSAMAGFALFGPYDWAPYAVNGFWLWLFLLVFDLLVLRGLDFAMKLALGVILLCVPLMGVLITDCRPDMAAGLVLALAIITGLWPPLPRSGWGFALLSGAFIGFALVIKPSAFAFTLGVAGLIVVVPYGLAWARATFGDRRSSQGAKEPFDWGLAIRNFLLYLSGILLLGGVHTALTLSRNIEYMRKALFDADMPIKAFEGPLEERLLFYFTGHGGQLMLGKYLVWFFAAVLIASAGVGLYVLLRKRRPEMVWVQASFAVLLLATWAVPTQTGVLQVFFGITFQSLLTLSAFVALREGILLSAHAWGMRAAVYAFAIATPFFFQWSGHIRFFRGDDPIPRQSKETIAAFTESIQNWLPPSRNPIVLLTSANWLSPQLISYELEKAGRAGVQLANDYTDGSAKRNQAFDWQLGRAHIVICSEPGNPLTPVPPARQQAEETSLDAIRQRQDYVQVDEFPLFNGTRYRMFVRRAPYAGIAATLGELDLLQPNVADNLQRVGRAPFTTLTAWRENGGDEDLTVEMTSAIGDQDVMISLNGQLLQVVRLEGEKKAKLTIPAVTQAGRNFLRFDYMVGQDAANPPKPWVVLFDGISLLPTKDKKPARPVSDEALHLEDAAPPPK
jgi:hypothetical protein